MSFTPEQIAALYNVTTYDYGPHHGQGVVVASGTGLMLAIMDQVPVRYCVDYDTAKEDKRCRIEDYMRLMARYAPPLCMVGWFTSTRPEAFQRGIAEVVADGHGDRVLCYSGGDVVRLREGQSVELGEYCARVRAWLAARE